MGEGVGRWPMQPTKGDWSDLAGDEGGGMGGGVGRWPMEGGQGGRWGGSREQCGSNKGALLLDNWSDLAGDEGGGMGAGVGRWPMKNKGEMGGGTESSVGALGPLKT